MSSALSLSLALVLSACGGEGSNTSNSATAAAPSPTPSPSPSPSPSSSPTPTPTPGTSVQGTASAQDEMLAVMLSTHNEAREEVGSPPLVLDDDLSAQALEYAQELADTGRFEHSSQSDRPGQGENLWAGTASAFRYEEMSGAWIDEKQYYVHMRFPYVSNTGNWQDVGHYTQIIWSDTTRLGCGLASSDERDYLVCRYAQPGNITGEFAY